MSTAILKLSESGELQKIHDKWLSRKAYSAEGAKQDVERLPLKSFWGLFLLCGSACFVALLLYLIKMIYQYMRHSGQNSQSAPIQSFLLFVKEKEKESEDVPKMHEPEKSGAMRKRRKRVSSGRFCEDESVNVSNVGVYIGHEA
jgi:ionotropic glutamate receptor